MNVFHAGDGNLHPLLVFDRREPGVWERVVRGGHRDPRRVPRRGRRADRRARRRHREARPHAAHVLARRPRRAGAAARRVRSRRRREPAQGAAAREPLRRAATRPGGNVDLADGDAGTAPVAPVGARTHWEVGGPPPAGAVEVRAPAGVIAYEPADMTITVGAGTSFAALDAALAEHGPGVRARPARSRAATIGGILACGLSGIRRLRHGPRARSRARSPVRDRRRPAREGRRPDGQERHRLRPARACSSARSARSACCSRRRCAAGPGAAARAGSHGADAGDALPAVGPACGTARARRCCSRASRPTSTRKRRGLDRSPDAPALPDGRAPRPHLGRRRGGSAACAARARRPACAGARSSASAPSTSRPTTPTRSSQPAPVAHAHGGWMLREAGGPRRRRLRSPAARTPRLMRRVKDAFDPAGRLNPGRLPLTADVTT